MFCITKVHAPYPLYAIHMPITPAATVPPIVDFSSVFYANVCVCNILYLLIFIISPLIASFFGDDNLCPFYPFNRKHMMRSPLYGNP